MRKNVKEDPSGRKKMKLDNASDDKELAERKRASENIIRLPRLTMNEKVGLQASVFFTEYAARTPLLLSDIQHLLTYLYVGNELVIPPPTRWCGVQEPNKLGQVVLLVVDGVGLNEFVENQKSFGGIRSIFCGDAEENKEILEVLDPKWYGDSVFGEVGRWGILGGGGKQSEGKKEADAESAQCLTQNLDPVMKQLRSIFPIKKSDNKGATQLQPSSSDKFPRTSLLLTFPQMVQENYPLPDPASKVITNVEKGYTMTSGSYSQVTPNSNMFSVDCEMCEAVGDANALIKIGVVDEELKTIYESLVKPKGEVIDYRTRWSGVSQGMMEGVETSLWDVQEKLREIVGQNLGCILVGHSLSGDFKAMRIIHPYVIDTSLIFNLSGRSGEKPSLKDLSSVILNETIQDKNSKQQGHCPVEDAKAVMKLIQNKLSNGYSFGNNLLSDKDSSVRGDKVDTSCLVPFRSHLFKSKLGECGTNNFNKNVVIIAQKDQQHTFPFFIDEAITNSARDSTSTTKDSGSATMKPAKGNLKASLATTSGNVIKLMHSNFGESEAFLTVGFYNLEYLDKNSKNSKTLEEMDKHVETLFNGMPDNSMLVVVGCGGADKRGEDDEFGRKNNGICFVRIKVDEMIKS